MGEQTKRRDRGGAGDEQNAPPAFPFAALVGQGELKLALLLNVIEPAVGGALIMGARGTGKTTAVRALAALLPPLAVVRGCAYNCDPDAPAAQLCADCRARRAADGRLPRARRAVPVVELPLNATEDRVCGALSFERALAAGVNVFEPGLLARANRGFLYIDEVNLLEDHLVDLLLDAAASGRNRVEREGVSVAHPARFVLVGSGNPEEGELRPQLLDRFGLFVEVRTPAGVDERVEVVARHESFARDPVAFAAEWANEQARLRRRVLRARRTVAQVAVARALVRRVAELCQSLGVDGHRGELTIVRAARALAAFEGRAHITEADVRRVAPLALRHRLRRDPLEQTEGGARVEQAVAEAFGGTTGGDAAEANDNVTRASDGERRRRPAPPADDDTGGRNAARPQTRTDTDGRAGDGRGVERAAPPAESDLRLELRAVEHARVQTVGAQDGSGRGRPGARRPAQRGRYVRASARRPEQPRVALDATLRVTATRRAGVHAHERDASSHEGSALAHGRDALVVTSSDLRFKQFSRRAGTLYVFAVDTSGSMALNRIEQAKGALARLLRQSYVTRDRVALVSFRERAATLVLRPTRAAARARRLLDALPVGGATPLAAGLLRAYELSRQERAAGGGRVALLVFTDGRANVPLNDASGVQTSARIADELTRLGALLRGAGVASVVVDTRRRFTPSGAGEALARALGGRYVVLPGG
ncbi:MAG TPA: magnesium chelatase ATPase subunit I [Pyrinomonadaceae bacterium]|jgi:magnesium chelatase subunit D